MKEMKKHEKIPDRDWDKLASILSGENDESAGEALAGKDIAETEKNWKALREMKQNNYIDVDKAWNKVYARIAESEIGTEKQAKVRTLDNRFLKIAATLLIIIGIGSLSVIFYNKASLSSIITVTASAEQRNVKADLPDGSTVYLNRNSKLSYKSNLGKGARNVTLTGEAFFEVAPDGRRPFTIDAGKASVRVVGTSFNVNTENDSSEVEVFVKTGKVLLSPTDGQNSLMLQPGDIGKTTSGSLDKSVNDDPNYLAWQTGMLVYKNEKLGIVFRDLKKVYDMNIVADDPSILQLPWTSPIDYQAQDNIIRMICLSFGLSYSKDGNVYHLTER